MRPFFVTTWVDHQQLYLSQGTNTPHSYDNTFTTPNYSFQYHRHGARLDTADTQWHLTSPTPYDPPLTYGGWKQSQTLGARIASILKGREDASDETHMNGNFTERNTRISNLARKPKRRKHKVVIHSSPFLRCVQTSIAIAAGMEQWNGKAGLEDCHVYAKGHALHSNSPHMKPKEHRNAPYLSAISEPDESAPRSRYHTAKKDKKDKAARAMLRLDAFLGEWLSPDYYENITPPPGSKMMVAGAKADLLRRGDPINALQASNNHHMNPGNFPGGWKSDRSPVDEPSKQNSSALSHVGELNQTRPKLGRANSHSVIGMAKRTNFQLASTLNGGQHSETTGYVSPTPAYAISPAQPIPQGYVAHARDACIDADYQWDSMRPPLEWGTGGDYGEEWSAMHRRFRGGLDEMILWYRNHEAFEEADEKSDAMEELSHVRTGPPTACGEDETDTVLILVTHGAGCNALIGALTNQPVLIDVGMASLTMAVRKDVDYKRLPYEDSLSISPTHRFRRHSVDPGTAEIFDVKLTASTDHLRPGSQFLRAPPPKLRSPNLPVREKSPYRYERHVSPASPTTTHHHQFSNQNSNIDNPIKETISSNLGESSFSETPSYLGICCAATTANFSSGLWSPTSHSQKPSSKPHNATNILPPQLDGVKEAEEMRPRSLQIDSPSSSAAAAAVTIPLNATSNGIANTNGSGTGVGKPFKQQGLWGAEPRALATERDQTMPKRRWTLTQA